MLKEITPGRLKVVFGCGGDRDRGSVRNDQGGNIARRLYWATTDNLRSEAQEQSLMTCRKAVDDGKIDFVLDRRRAIEAV